MEGRVSEEPYGLASDVPMEICEGSDSEPKTAKKNHASGIQTGVDASHGHLGGCLKTCQVKRKRVNEMVQSRVDASHGQLGRGLETHQVKRRRFEIVSDSELLLNYHGQTIISVDLEYAKIALDFYEKRQNAKFEILEVLFSSRATLIVPGFKGVGPWCHVSFIAKPKNSDCCAKHFFGEMVLDRASEEYNVTFCSMFDPSDPGNVHGCVFCPGSEMYLHPPDGCPAGGREIDKFMIQKEMDASRGQVRGCSKRHQKWPNQYLLTPDARTTFIKRRTAIEFKYAKIALEFYEKKKDVEFEIIEAWQSSKRVVVPGSKSIQECCHVVFNAKPKNVVDCTKRYFFGEMLRDPTTGKYSATSCRVFTTKSNWKVGHNCIICPKDWRHPIKGYRVGRPPCSIEEESYLDGLQLDLNLQIL